MGDKELIGQMIQIGADNTIEEFKVLDSYKNREFLVLSNIDNDIFTLKTQSGELKKIYTSLETR